jgi:hypothetical protein
MDYKALLIERRGSWAEPTDRVLVEAPMPSKEAARKWGLDAVKGTGLVVEVRRSDTNLLLYVITQSGGALWNEDRPA